ncbi:MAG: hypothetical protein ACRD5H_11460, partial [Nitrososphaerales archaeon]
VHRIPRYPIPLPGVGPIDEHAQALMLEVEPSMIDKDHQINSIVVNSLVTAERDYIGEVRFVGLNMSGKPSTCITGEVTVVGALSLQDVGLQAWSGADKRQTLVIRPLLSASIHRLMFQVLFMTPVPPGGEFDISYSFRLPKAMYSKDDYDILNIARFQRGVARLSYALSTPLKLVGPMLFEVRRSGLYPYPSQIIHRYDSLKGSEYFVEVANPNPMGYLFFYHELK